MLHGNLVHSTSDVIFYISIGAFMEEKYNYYNDDFVICRASMDDAGLIYDMMMEVYSGLEDKSVLVCGDIDYVRRNIQDTGFALIAYHKESMTM